MTFEEIVVQTYIENEGKRDIEKLTAALVAIVKELDRRDCESEKLNAKHE
jgi:hypothetical protein